MGYTTYFSGELDFNKPVTQELGDYINRFNQTRRIKRDVEKIKEIFPNWQNQCFNGELGDEGEYFVGGTGFCGQDCDESVLNYNHSPADQPGLWCQWIIEGDKLVWDEGEKFYNYIEWLIYLIDHFFKPLDYVLNGEIFWEGEHSDDFGCISVENNVVTVQEGKRYYSMSDFSTDVLIKELTKRGYTVTEALNE